ncbi:MBL fold metallo-hydrolase [uncultured Propionivibrio sp.]|uniref:MBL fold metallo-hydrolase n=1 Tax=uncultured Propionivibrio sp. TaxID=426737 RepID=UPI0029C081D9|nr:MBL fold metallo-hydrolase [uncultured Propionivibrio sp.]
MTAKLKLNYYGWSSLSLDTDEGRLLFDPFFRPYCGAEWFHLEDFSRADYICVTHGHEEHILDVPVVARTSGATVVSSPTACKFLMKRRKLYPEKVKALDPAKFEAAKFPGFEITAFPWKHRDINLVTSITKQLLKGSTTQLAWAWSSLTNAPFYAPFTGFHIKLPSGLTVLNYNEGFNYGMTDEEITDLGRRFKTDILLGGMQLNFMEDLARGVAALKPKVVVLYPPHEMLFRMMGAKSEPPADFVRAITSRFPSIQVFVAEPGFELNVNPIETPTLFQ